jgi:hypothetical protein
MPFTEEGITPDLIINPHCIPKRMTVGQLVECLVGKVAAIKGVEADGTSFNEIDLEQVKDELEKLGYERNATEYMYSGLTGQKLKMPIFIGPTYYQRLKHLVMDKMHCLKAETTDVLTFNGWKKYSEFTKDDLIATLVDGKLVYEKPKEIFYYPDFNDKLYHISNSDIELDVTMKHRMWVSKMHEEKQEWQSYNFEYAEDIIDKQRKYKKDAEWDASDYQFILPKIIDDNNEQYDEKIVDMNSWITFLGIWITYGSICKNIEITINKQIVKEILYSTLTTLGYKFKVENEILIINDFQLVNYLKQFSNDISTKFLPEWCFNLSKYQSELLVNSMLLNYDSLCKTTTCWYSTTSNKLADQLQQICIHAGYVCNKFKHMEVENNQDVWRLNVIKNNINPIVNYKHIKNLNSQQEFKYHYKGPVFCVEVSSGVFMIRSGGKTCWTGNSRSRGPNTILTRQAAEGRSKDGGLKCGEFHFATKSTDYNPVLVH